MIWWKQNSDNFLQCLSDLQSTVEPLLWDISIKGHRLHSGYIKSGLTKCSHNNNFVYVTPKQRQKKIKSFTKHGKTLWLVISLFPVSTPIPQNSEKKPQGIYFSKALSEGLIYREKWCITKLARLIYLEKNLWLRIDWASLQLEETLCQKLLLKNVLRR